MNQKTISNNAIPVIPMTKGYVRGYYEKRNGKLVYISPYENSKTRKQQASSHETNVNLPNPIRKKAAKPEVQGHVNPKPVAIDKTNEDPMNFVLQIILAIVKTIDSFEDGERVRLALPLRTAKTIVRELGYLDETIEVFFQTPKVKSTRLSDQAARETSAMVKQLKRLSRRVVKATLREKIQKMALQLSEAI
jgi:hypothetical protein